MANVLDSLRGQINPVFFNNQITNKLQFNVDFSQYAVTVSNSGNTVNVAPKRLNTPDGIPHRVDFIEFGYNPTSRTVYYNVVSQSYCIHQNRYPVSPEPYAEVFVQSSSEVIKLDGTTQYTSWYSDEARVHQPTIDLANINLAQLLANTSPLFNEGVMIESPIYAYAPFSSFSERYPGTHVVREYGRNPMHGEHSNIGITFDRENISNFLPVKESYGRLAFYGDSIPVETEELVEKMEEIYGQTFDGQNFDQDEFTRKLLDYQQTVKQDLENR